jgi:hypothetical protein
VISAELKMVDEYVQEIMSLLFGYQYSEGTPLEISVRDLRSLIGLVQVDTLRYAADKLLKIDGEIDAVANEMQAELGTK